MRRVEYAFMGTGTCGRAHLRSCCLSAIHNISTVCSRIGRHVAVFWFEETVQTGVSSKISICRIIATIYGLYQKLMHAMRGAGSRDYISA